jgi:hypothetical protein
MFDDEFWAELLPDGWDTDGYGIDSNLICPHGNVLEQDCRGAGTCGCVSPLVEMGLI